MNDPENKFFIMYLLLFVGVIQLIFGIKTVINKNYLSVSKWIDPRSWRPPVLIKGKKAVTEGIISIIMGIAWIALFWAIYNEVK
jgi:hypothetical protein